MTAPNMRALLPDVPGKVHGIVSLDPPTIQCDGCGATFSQPKLAMAVLLSGIRFDPRRYGRGDRRRMCTTCWAHEPPLPSRGEDATR